MVEGHRVMPCSYRAPSGAPEIPIRCDGEGYKGFPKREEVLRVQVWTCDGSGHYLLVNGVPSNIPKPGERPIVHFGEGYWNYEITARVRQSLADIAAGRNPGWCVDSGAGYYFDAEAAKTVLSALGTVGPARS